MPGPRLLVFAGDNGLGHEDRYARVVFALQSKFDFSSRAYVRTQGDFDSPEPLTPAWYYWLEPTIVDAYQARCDLGSPNDGRAERHFALKIRLTEDVTKVAKNPITFERIVDERGSFIGTPLAGDEYRARRDRLPEGDPLRLPDPEVFRLVPPSPPRQP